jgi:hypothetical protein
LDGQGNAMRRGITTAVVSVAGGAVLAAPAAEVVDFLGRLVAAEWLPEHWMGYGPLFWYALPRAALLCLAIYGIAWFLMRSRAPEWICFAVATACAAVVMICATVAVVSAEDVISHTSHSAIDIGQALPYAVLHALPYGLAIWGMRKIAMRAFARPASPHSVF